MAAVLKKNERNCTASFAREENGKTVTDKVKTPTLKLDCEADDIDAVITGLEVLKEGTRSQVAVADTNILEQQA